MSHVAKISQRKNESMESQRLSTTRPYQSNSPWIEAIHEVNLIDLIQYLFFFFFLPTRNS